MTLSSVRRSFVRSNRLFTIQAAHEFIMGVIESLSQLRGNLLLGGVGRMQIGMIALEEPSPGLPHRVDIGTVRQLEVGKVARQLRVLRRHAARPGRRSLPA